MKDVTIPNGLIIADLFGDLLHFITYEAVEMIVDFTIDRSRYLGTLNMPNGGFAICLRCEEAPDPADFEHWAWRLARALAGNGAVHFVNQEREVTRLYARNEKAAGTLYKGKLVYCDPRNRNSGVAKYINAAGNGYKVVP